MDLVQAFLLGLFGSLHCVGMCGPIALALPVKLNSWSTRLLGGLVYNSGRILTYSLMGFTLGILGYGFFFWGVQRWVSVFLGALMILAVLLPMAVRNLQSVPGIRRVASAFTGIFGKLFGSSSYISVFTIGLLNGLLPCGLVYIALAGALVASDPLHGAVLMFLFGAGTIPVLLFVTLAGNIIGIRFRNRVRKIIPYFIILIGVLFILRGLNLGIPYISPKMTEKKNHPACCHEEK
jgi:uncharacterized protein